MIIAFRQTKLIDVLTWLCEWVWSHSICNGWE